MRSFSAFFLVGAIVIISGCAAIQKQPPPSPPPQKEVYTGPLLVPAEDPIPGVPAEVQFADFWIRKAAEPDAVMLSPAEIETFNRENPARQGVMLDILTMPDTSEGNKIRDYMAANARYLLDARFYVTADIPLEKAERARIAALMDTLGVPDLITIKFGMILRNTMGKLWPTNIPLMSTPGDNEFDRGVASTLDMGEPVALLHVSRDGLWSYVQSSSFGCWVPSEDVAFGDRELIKDLADTSMPVVAIGSRVSVFPSPEGGAAIGSITMGSYLPARSAGNDFCEVLFPCRGPNGELAAKKGYVRNGSDVSLGFLPYTLRNVYQQCFKFFGFRYGWGGMFGDRDCSATIMEVFRCFNIRLPRNSASQAGASPRIVKFDGLDRAARLQALRTVPGGVTLLRMPGHIMIYLGEADGKPYAIHNFWAWREPKPGKVDVTHRAARVAVTDLMLGEGSQRGAFIDRLTNAAIIGR
ncbi:MAG: SH3 domain-containing protein [Candidatus Latescibacter sp.]|nr:SH3 domain-containing protein [Candidatus Latescibacter sp.]